MHLCVFAAAPHLQANIGLSATITADSAPSTNKATDFLLSLFQNFKDDHRCLSKDVLVAEMMEILGYGNSTMSLVQNLRNGLTQAATSASSALQGAAACAEMAWEGGTGRAGQEG